MERLLTNPKYRAEINEHTDTLQKIASEFSATYPPEVAYDWLITYLATYLVSGDDCATLFL